MPKANLDKTTARVARLMQTNLQNANAQRTALRTAAEAARKALKSKGTNSNLPDDDGEFGEGFDGDPFLQQIEAQEEKKDQTPEAKSIEHYEKLGEEMSQAGSAPEIAEDHNNMIGQPVEDAFEFVHDTGLAVFEQVSTNQVSRDRANHADMFTSVVCAGRDEGLCFGMTISGDGMLKSDILPETLPVQERITPFMVEDLSPELAPYHIEIDTIGDIVEKRLNEKFLEAGIESVHAEFPLSLARKQGIKPEEAVINILSGIREQIVKPYVEKEVFVRQVVERQEKV